MARKRPPQSDRLRVRKDVLRYEVAELERQRQQIRQDIDAARRELDRVKPQY